MSWMFTVVGVSTATSVASSVMASNSANAASNRAQANANRRYELQASQSENMMEEQQIIARDKMTDISRAFLVAKGKSTAIQAETGVTGASSERMKAVERTKFSEAKGKVAQETDTNVINIANGMLTKKIDTEAMISEAESQKKNVFTNAVMAGISGAASGYSMGKSIGASGAGTAASGKYVAPDSVGGGGSTGWNNTI